jgi:hypothetical protein
MPSIKGGDPVHIEALGYRDDRCVNGPGWAATGDP